MAEYHVGLGYFGYIYAGTLSADKKTWKAKSEVTKEVETAYLTKMAEELIYDKDNTKHSWTFNCQGRKFRLMIEEVNTDEKMD